MMSEAGETYLVRYAPQIAEDLDSIGRTATARVLERIRECLRKAPLDYGQRLRSPFSRYHKLRAGQYRVIYRVRDDRTPPEVWVLLVGKRSRGDREDVYGDLSRGILERRFDDVTEGPDQA